MDGWVDDWMDGSAFFFLRPCTKDLHPRPSPGPSGWALYTPARCLTVDHEPVSSVSLSYTWCTSGLHEKAAAPAQVTSRPKILCTLVSRRVSVTAHCSSLTPELTSLS